MPPRDFTSLAQQVWNAAMTSRCSSASRRVESALDPTMSQNMIVNCRRSTARAAGTEAGFGRGAASTGFEMVERVAPHSEQNFALSELAWPHEAHARGSGVPHSSQNLLPPGMFALQSGQFMNQFPAT